MACYYLDWRIARSVAFGLSVAPGEYFGVYGILRANAVDGSSDAFNTLTMEFDPVSAASLEAAGIPPVTMITVTVDIKPDRALNTVNPRNNEVIPVAVLGSIDLDATQVDPATVTFGVDGAQPAPGAKIEDVDMDGFMDVLFEFETQDTGIVCGDTEVTLDGELFDGTTISGTDTIETIGCSVSTASDDDDEDDENNSAAMSWWFLLGLGLLGFRGLARPRRV